MTYREDQHNQAKSDMLGEFNKAILDAEDLRKAETEVSDDVSAATKKNLEQKPGSAGAEAAGASRTVVETGEEKV
jgi:hypothetical protein